MNVTLPKFLIVCALMYAAGFLTEFEYYSLGTRANGWSMHAPAMPPGYVLQTDGYNFRTVVHEGNGVCFTNWVGSTPQESAEQAWTLYRMNSRLHEWRDVK